MSTNGYKLNRSLSESDISNTAFDNLTLNGFLDQRSPQPQVIRRAFYIEEVIDSNSQTVSRFSSCQDIFGSQSASCFDLSRMTISSSNLRNTGNCQLQTRPHPHHSNKIVPMDIDGSQEENSHANNMDVEYIENVNDHIEHEKYRVIHDVLRRRNMNVTSNLDSVLGSDDYGSRDFKMAYNADRNSHELQFNNYERGYSPVVYGSAFGRQNMSTPTPSNSNTGTNLDKLKTIQKTEQKSMLVKLQISSKRPIPILIGALFFFIAIIGYFIYQGEFLLYVNHDNQVDNIRTDLIKSVHGQQKAIDTVIRILESRKNWKSKQKLLALTGPSGVGKTHIANIIKQHFHQKLVKDVLMVHLTYKSKREEITEKLNSCCLNLIVIDNTKRSDIVELIAFFQSLPKQHFILVVSIFNFHDADDLNYVFDLKHVRQVRDLLEDSDLFYELVVFEHFNDTHVIQWLEKEMAAANVAEKVHKAVINNVLEGHNVKLHGLKGLGAKLSFELEKLKT